MNRRVGVLVGIMVFLAAADLSTPPAAALSQDRKFVNSVGMEFVLIPAGTFLMGSPPDEANRDRDEVLHRVTISRPFYLQTTEVTRGQWRKLMGSRFFGFFKRGRHQRRPVVKVSWYDAMEFIEKLNALNEGRYRLPTEAEWEYACRAGSRAAYCWGDEISCDQAMFANNSLKSDECVPSNQKRGLPTDACTHVANYAPNAWGLYDMHGNVWEWCFDWYGPYPSGPAVDPKGPPTGTKKVRRSGSWFKHAWQCRCANRNYAHPASRLKNLGFRVVRETE